ncbi:hypothetical protein BJ878DRAFT_543263 [Calycina marina]|uniref:THUMP domain-containing protein n=1 Tax=Calycina marina TaxID=1763456 RepID=A0A9P8CDV9_9HELO|nr:hypothetical protein BJ878DRAFT_543263 [Calycina marina]
MADASKRKKRPVDDRDQIGGPKRSKGNSRGKWQTPHQITKSASRGGGARIEPGDQGIWATCAKGQEGRATGELFTMFAECAERFYGILAAPEENLGGDDEDDEDVDIEASIKKEMATIGESRKQPKLFSSVRTNAPCVLFFKTRAPIDPCEFVHRICNEIVADPKVKRLKYINRLTPMILMGRATESGLQEVGKMVLAKHFRLSGDDVQKESGTDEGVLPSYAIRPTIRTHRELQRDVVIKAVANMVDNAHGVNLTKPDKVILVEIYQTVCGMSVVGDDWEALKRYNISELYGGYKANIQAKNGSLPQEALPEAVSINEVTQAS